MGVGARMFFFEEDGALRSMPWGRYMRLYEGNPSVLRTDYFITYFDGRGRVDHTKKEGALRLAVNMAGPDLTERGQGPVMDAHRRLSAKRCRDRFKWTPTREEEAKIGRRIERMFAVRKA